MLDEKDLQAISTLMDSKLQPVNNRLDRIEGRLDNIENRLETVENSLEEIRGATNYMVEWIEKVEKKVDEIA